MILLLYFLFSKPKSGLSRFTSLLTTRPLNNIFFSNYFRVDRYALIVPKNWFAPRILEMEETIVGYFPRTHSAAIAISKFSQPVKKYRICFREKRAYSR